jgi:hypothetical protein
MTTYTGISDPATVLRIKLTEVLYVPRVWQWYSITRSQADASRTAGLCYLEGTLPAGGKLVRTFLGKNASDHQIVHLELPATHKSLKIAPECLTVLCILDSCLPSSFVDKVDVITSELVLRGFIMCLDVEGAHGDL